MDLAKRTEGLLTVYNNQIKYLQTKKLPPWITGFVLSLNADYYII